MSYFKRSKRKYVKKAYGVRNWNEYEAGLRERGSLTVWISLNDGKLANWDATRLKKKKPGRQRKYSNHAIETTVTLGMVFHMASRTTEGFLRSLFALLNLDIDVPDHALLHKSDRGLESLGLDYHHPTIWPSGLPSAVILFRILHPIRASTLCDESRLARIAEPTMVL